MGESGTPPSLHRYLYAYSNPTVYVDLYGREAVGLNPAVYKETDLFPSPPVRDTGSQVADVILATADSVIYSLPAVLFNAGSAVLSSPTIAYAKATDQTVQQADEELTGYMASAGPLAPMLMTGTTPFRIGPKLGHVARVARAEAKAVAKTTKKITKAAANGMVDKVFDASINMQKKVVPKVDKNSYAYKLQQNEIRNDPKLLKDYDEGKFVSTKMNDAGEIPSSSELRKNMEKAGNPVGVDEDAAHIVAGTHRRHARAREIIKGENIPINNGRNGAALPSNNKVQNPEGKMRHPQTHTYESLDKVSDMMEEAKSNGNVKETLELIQQLQQSGDFL